MNRLLQPGWAGILDYSEAVYIQSHLKKSVILRSKWGLHHKGCPLVRIAEKAYPEDKADARRNILSEVAKAPRA